MRGLTIATIILLTGAALGALATPASAFTWCVDHVPDHDCREHVACIGWSPNASGGERCQYAVPSDLCDLIHCGPGPVLP